MTARWLAFAVVAPLVSAGGAAADPPPPRSAAATQLLAAAARYADWGRVDVAPRVAPELCAAPRPPVATPPTTVRLSAAARGEHTKKLYYLWASDRAAYLTPKATVPAGFAIVKESFAAVHGAARDAKADGLVTADGERLTVGARKDLFIMVKQSDAAAEGTDAGWIYGTVSPDGQVTSEGRVASCMGCHTRAARDRLFGVATAP